MGLDANQAQRTYRIMTLPSFDGLWDSVPPASIDCRPWSAGGALPPAEARVAFDGDRLHVRLRAWGEKPVVVTHTHNGPVWEDSCIEFFLNPSPCGDTQYLNFELNAEGVMLLGFGADRHSRKLIEFDPAEFRIAADVPPGGASRWDKPFYTLYFEIPKSFLEGLYGRLDLHSGSVMAGNFQKCGEKTGNPHYGVWNPILSERPDFHRPEDFGEIVLA